MCGKDGSDGSPEPPWTSEEAGGTGSGTGSGCCVNKPSEATAETTFSFAVMVRFAGTPDTWR